MLDFHGFLDLAEKLLRYLPTKSVEVGYGDFNDNGTPDVRVKITLKDGAELVFGPIDVPAADIGALLESLKGMLD